MTTDTLGLLTLALVSATFFLAVLVVWLILAQRRVLLLSLDSPDLTPRLDALARRVEGDGEVLRRNLADLGRDLHLTIARSAKDGLAETFGRVQQGADVQAAALRLIVERLDESAGRTGSALAGQREALLRGLAEGREAAARDGATARETLTRDLAALAERTRVESERLREAVGTKLDELRAGNEAKLEEMRRAVDERLQSALEKSFGESFQRVADQFAEVQRAIGDVRVVTSQVGDLKRLFSNVKSRGGWGEAHLKALLDDVLPPGAYASNVKLHEDKGDVVEFALRMPVKGGDAEVWLPIDSKFPIEDYQRVLDAAEAGDPKAEAEARRALDNAFRTQAKLIRDKYVVPPRTVEFAVMYLPTEGLFAEVHRSPGLVAELQAKLHVIVVGPTLLPALLHHIRLGHLTLTLERKASAIGDTLGAVKGEWAKLGEALEAMGKRAAGLHKDIERAQVRTRAVGRKLRTVDAIEGDRAETLLGFEGEILDLTLAEDEAELRAAE